MPAVKNRYLFDLGCIAVLCVIPLAAYLSIAALGFSADPLPLISGLGHVVREGRLPGSPGWIDPNGGTTLQSIGGLAASDWLQRTVPWWNPYVGVGMPLAAGSQPAALFLPFVLLLKIGNGIMPLRVAMQIAAGLATFGLLRELRLGRYAALIGGILFQFNGTFAWFADAPSLPIAFLPLLLLGIEGARTKAAASQRGGWIVIAVAIAYSLYAGFPETAFLDGLLGLAFAIQRLFVLPGRLRVAFARKVLGGGTLGVFLAAPFLVPLLEYLTLAQTGLHEGFETRGLPAAGLPAFLMPYVYGPIFAFNGLEPSGKLSEIWGNIGGYLGLTLVFLANLGAVSSRRERGLQLTLVAWLLIVLARIFALPIVTQVIAAIPILNLTAIYRYAEPSAGMATIMLAGFALDAWHADGLGASKVWLAALGCALAAAASLGAGAGLIGRLVTNVPEVAPYLLASVGWAMAVLAAAAVLLMRRPTMASSIVLGSLLITDAAGLFSLPLLSGARATQIDLEPIAFLRKNIGLQRVYTVGPMAPNYGTYFRLAQINHDMIPVDADWIRFIRSTLDPGIWPPIFTGLWPGPVTDRQQAMREHVTGFEAAAVRYVMVKAGSEPFSLTLHPSLAPTGQLAKPLFAGDTLSGAMQMEQAQDGNVSAVSVLVGTYKGRASGRIELQLCGMTGCVTGSATLDGAADNQPLSVLFPTTLHVATGEVLHYQITYEGGDGPLAIWWRPQAMQPSGSVAAWMPDLALRYVSLGQAPHRVFGDGTADIYELANPAPYFQANCVLTRQTRQSLHAVCDQAGTLVRREMFYPGWQAEVNGVPTPLVRSASIFQAIALPVGDSDIRFSYVPSYMGWACLAALSGAFVVAVGIWRMGPGLLPPDVRELG